MVSDSPGCVLVSLLTVVPGGYKFPTFPYSVDRLPSVIFMGIVLNRDSPLGCLLINYRLIIETICYTCFLKSSIKRK